VTGPAICRRTNSTRSIRAFGSPTGANRDPRFHLLPRLPETRRYPSPPPLPLSSPTGARGSRDQARGAGRAGRAGCPLGGTWSRAWRRPRAAAVARQVLVDQPVGRTPCSFDLREAQIAAHGQRPGDVDQLGGRAEESSGRSRVPSARSLRRRSASSAATVIPARRRGLSCTTRRRPRETVEITGRGSRTVAHTCRVAHFDGLFGEACGPDDLAMSAVGRPRRGQ